MLLYEHFDAEMSEILIPANVVFFSVPAQVDYLAVCSVVIVVIVWMEDASVWLHISVKYNDDLCRNYVYADVID